MLLTLLDTSRGAQVLVPSFAPNTADPPGTPPTAGAVLLAIGNIAATRDPGATDDVNAGYSVGSVWFNATAGALRAWMCRDNTASAAKWTFEGSDFANGGTNPNTEATQAGSSTATIAAEGNIFRQVIAAPGQICGGSGADYVLGLYSIPANLFDGVGNRGVTITAQGSFGGTGNNKRCKIVVGASGGTVGGVVGGGGIAIADTGVVTTNGSGWSIQANVFKYGVAGSNTQLGIHQQSQTGGTVTPLVAPQNLTLVESGAILVAITGNAATLANDIALNFLEINMMN